jgi:3'(2'), 5'-bisphosphate nucleotidase
MGSSAIKFGWLAEGHADLHVRCGPTMAWDIAAGDHILHRAGGAVARLDGELLRYDTAENGYRNGPFFAVGRQVWREGVLEAAQRAS